MEIWAASLISPLLVGIIVTMVKIKLDEVSKNSDELIRQRFRTMDEKLSLMKDDMNLMRIKMDKMSEELHSVTLRVSSLSKDYEHLSNRLLEIISNNGFKKDGVEVGRVIKK